GGGAARVRRSAAGNARRVVRHLGLPGRVRGSTSSRLAGAPRRGARGGGRPAGGGGVSSRRSDRPAPARGGDLSRGKPAARRAGGGAGTRSPGGAASGAVEGGASRRSGGRIRSRPAARGARARSRRAP